MTERAEAPDSGTGQTAETGKLDWRRKLIVAGLGVWLAFQVLYPLRHLLYPGSPSWTEEGHRFAWQMKLRDKRGTARFEVRDPQTGRVWQVDPRDYLTRRQAWNMPVHPDMVLQFAHYLAEVWRRDHGVPDAEVRATVLASLNGRRRAPMIDPDRDLAQVERNLLHADWILPLDVPLYE